MPCDSINRPDFDPAIDDGVMRDFSDRFRFGNKVFCGKPVDDPAGRWKKIFFSLQPANSEDLEPCG
jgi:hypothetical protein